MRGQATPWPLRPESFRERFQSLSLVTCLMNSQSSNFCFSGLCREIHCEELFLLLPIQIFSCFGSRSVLHHISSIHSLEYWFFFIQKTGHHMGCKYYYYLQIATTSATITCLGIKVLCIYVLLFYFFLRAESLPGLLGKIIGKIKVL